MTDFHSRWLAAKGIGEINETLREGTNATLREQWGGELSAFAHTAAVLANDSQKAHFVRLFDQALIKVEGRATGRE